MKLLDNTLSTSGKHHRTKTGVLLCQQRPSGDLHLCHPVRKCPQTIPSHPPSNQVVSEKAEWEGGTSTPCWVVRSPVPLDANGSHLEAWAFTAPSPCSNKVPRPLSWGWCQRRSNAGSRLSPRFRGYGATPHHSVSDSSHEAPLTFPGRVGLVEAYGEPELPSLSSSNKERTPTLVNKGATGLSPSSGWAVSSLPLPEQLQKRSANTRFR